MRVMISYLIGLLSQTWKEEHVTRALYTRAVSSSTHHGHDMNHRSVSKHKKVSGSASVAQSPQGPLVRLLLNRRDDAGVVAQPVPPSRGRAHRPGRQLGVAPRARRRRLGPAEVDLLVGGDPRLVDRLQRLVQLGQLCAQPRLPRLQRWRCLA